MALRFLPFSPDLGAIVKCDEGDVSRRWGGCNSARDGDEESSIQDHTAELGIRVRRQECSLGTCRRARYSSRFAALIIASGITVILGSRALHDTGLTAHGPLSSPVLAPRTPFGQELFVTTQDSLL